MSARTPPDTLPDAATIARWQAAMPRAFTAAPRTRLRRALLWAAFAVWLALVLWGFDITPERLWRGASGLFKILRLMVPPSPGEQWRDMLNGIGESVAMAFAGSLGAVVLAVPMSFLGARNVVVNALAHFSLRRAWDGLRGIDQLIWALAFVRAVGLGPLAGVLAIMAAEVAVMAKLFAEAIENVDPGPGEAITATGAHPLLRLRFGMLPQVLPVMVALFLYSVEANTRSASILGVVGAGGIGLQIAERIKVRYWDEVAFIIILILITVAAIDFVSAAIRRRVTA